MSDVWRIVRFLLQPSADAPSARGVMALVLLSGAVSGAASTGLIVLINRAVATDLGHGLLWAFLGLCFLLPLARYLSQILLVYLAQRTLLGLRMSLCRRILSNPLRRLEVIGPHRILATLTEDVSTVREVSIQVPLMCMHFTVVAGCLVYLAWLSWGLLLVVVSCMAIGVVTYRAAVRRGLVYFRRVREGMDRLILHFRGLSEGVKELKLHRPRRFAFLARLLEVVTAIQRDNTAATRIYALANSWGQTLSFALIGLIFFLHQEREMFAAETFTGAVLTILYVRTPLDALLQMIPSFNRASVSLDSIQRLGTSLGSETSEEAPRDLAPPEGDWESLELAGVTHVYRREEEESDFILGPVELTFRPGELVFVVGGNGSGKTTLAKLILGLYQPEEGEIRLDGEKITDENRESYLQYFSAVFSDFYLFDSLLGMEQRQDLDGEARHYLALLHLDRKVKIQEGNLSTTSLSQGQRKRLALLTAYLEDRPIYLFDEWAADQDPYFKEIFYLELLPQLRARGKTVLVISHDDRYYHVADRVIKLEYGKIVFDGSRAEYLASFPQEVRVASRRAMA